MTTGDYIGWSGVILLFMLVIGLVLLVWRKALFGNGRASDILFFLKGLSHDESNVPLLLICGDEAFCEDDEAQLQRARIWFRKLEHATLKTVERELQRRRVDGSLYKWMHISAHGTADGFSLSNGDFMTSNWAADNFEGIQVVFAAACDSADVGDHLAGIVDAVVVVYGKRGSSLISTFACTFWRELAETMNVRRAYYTALREVPTLRPFVDLRLR